jgi:small-conductance mechanosensitive channel
MRRVKDEQNVKKIMTIWRVSFFIIIGVLAFYAVGGKLVAAGILSAAFLGMILGWSLQAPITSIAAWLFVVTLKPFKIGDRIIIVPYGLIGDVKKIGMMFITLEQVGGTIAGEETSGRAILLPNTWLFSQVFINYTLREEEEIAESRYILDEIPVRITFESDWDEAERILINAAKEVTADIVKATGREPFIRAEFLDWGFLMRLRYNTRAVERPEISTKIIKIIFHEFAKSNKVEICYPHSEIIYKPKDMNQSPAFKDEKRIIIEKKSPE